MFTYLWDDPAKVPDPLNAFVIGAGKTGFIGHVAHVPALRALQTVFNLRWASPSRNADQCELFRAHTHLPQKRVRTEWRSLLQHARQMDADGPIVCLYTDTPQHMKMMVEAMDEGTEWIIVDKPAVTSMAEFNTVSAAQDLTGIYVTYNHPWNPAVFQLRELCREAGPDGIVTVDSWFLQPWCCEYIPPDKPGGKQQDWRLAHVHGAALDIGTHEAHLASFVLDSSIVKVSNGSCERKGKHGRPCLDTGSCTLHFENGVIGTSRYSNATPGYADDIGAAVSFRKGPYAGWKVMWRMCVCGGNALLVGRQDADPLKIFGGDGWTRHLERGSSDFSGEVNQMFGFQPPGHGYDWTNMWQFLYLAIAGDILQNRDVLRDEQLPPIMRQNPPTFEVDGQMTQRFVHALDQSFVNGGTEVKLADVGDSYLASPPPEEHPSE